MQQVILQRLAGLAEMMEAKLANGEQIDVGEHVLLTSIMDYGARRSAFAEGRLFQNNPVRSRIPRRRDGKRGRHWRQHLRGLAGASSGGTAINTIVNPDGLVWNYMKRTGTARKLRVAQRTRIEESLRARKGVRWTGN